MFFKRTFIMLLCLFCLSSKANAQHLNRYSLQQVEGLQLKEQRPVLVFMTTSWCRYCQAMKQKTFKDKRVIALLNSTYYTVFIEADSKEDIVFQNKKYQYKSNGVGTGYNQILTFFYENKPFAFPSLFLFDNKWKPLISLQTYLNADAFLEHFLVEK